MTTKELIQAEIEGIGEEHLEDLYRLIRNFAESRHDNRQQSFMSKLKRIQIDAPEDFAANLDLYVSGEKRAE
jgi:hypothetical protein